MKITVLGSSSGLTVTHRNQSAYLLETKKQLFLIDAGEGVSQQLVKYKIDHNQIETLFISHTHPDHVSGLFGLLQMMHLTDRKKSLNIYLPHDVLKGIENSLPYFQIFREKWSFQFQFNSVAKGLVYESKTFKLYAIPNDHLRSNELYARQYGMTSDSYSFLLCDASGKNVWYTSDADSLNHLTTFNEMAENRVHLLISEFAHISMKEIVDFAVTKKIPKVIITHITPKNEKYVFKSESPVKIDWAADGYAIEV